VKTKIAITLAAILGDVTGNFVTQQKFNRGLPSNPLPLYLEGGMSLLIYESYNILQLRSKNEELLIPSTNEFYFSLFNWTFNIMFREQNSLQRPQLEKKSPPL